MAILRGQKLRNDCGPTCFANTLNILGYDIKIQKANELCGLKKEGTDSFDLIKAFDRYGFFAEEKETTSKKIAWSWLVRDTKKGLPITISVDNDTHWILVLRAGPKYVQIFDPDDNSPKKISKKELLVRWSYLEENKTKPRFHGLALYPYRKKSIQAVALREQMLATINV